MFKWERSHVLNALWLVFPFVAVYAVWFVYPTYKMLELSFTDAKLIGEGDWVGFANYVKLFNDKLFRAAVWNTAYFVLLTVIPGTLIALAIALMVQRLKGWVQSLILAATTPCWSMAEPVSAGVVSRFEVLDMGGDDTGPAVEQTVLKNGECGWILLMGSSTPRFLCPALQPFALNFRIYAYGHGAPSPLADASCLARRTGAC